MELDNIKLQTTWNDAANSINSNNRKIGNEIDRLRASTYKNKGYFASVNALISAYPSGSAGSKAYIGSTYPYTIYVWDTATNAWINSGQTGGEEEVKLEDYYTKEQTHQVIEEYHVILSQEEYDALETKENKLYFTYEED